MRSPAAVPLALLAMAAAALPARPQAAPSAPPVDEVALIAAGERGSVRALLQLAEARVRRGDVAGSAAPLRAALALAPNSERVLATYARASLAARAPGTSLLALEPLARMHPTVAEYSYLLGVAWVQLGDGASALPPLEHARALEPRRALTLAALGLALNQLQRYGDARGVLAEALHLAPDDGQVLASLAEAAEGLGDLAAAEAHAVASLAAAPGQPIARLALGMVRMKQERYAEAREALAAAVAAAPDSAKAHYQLSLACSRLGDRACAGRELELYRAAQRATEERIQSLRTQSLESGVPLP
jgi:tetratricopeptide (TPR) repeat protein